MLLTDLYEQMDSAVVSFKKNQLVDVTYTGVCIHVG